MKKAYSSDHLDHELDYSALFHLEHPVILRDLDLNYFSYFNSDRNLLLDIGNQSKILETLRENQLEKTTLGAQAKSTFTDKKKGSKSTGTGSSEDDMCYVCGSGDSEENNEIVYCEVRIHV